MNRANLLKIGMLCAGIVLAVAVTASHAQDKRAPAKGKGTASANQSKTTKTPPAATATPPAAARKTLFCLSIATPDRVREANELKQRLIDQTKMPDWYVVHSDAASVIYYGHYKAIDKTNPADAKRAKADLEKIRLITNARGDRLFRAAVFVETGTDDPPAPPEWNLLNAGADRYWTLVVADFIEIPNRKEAAVDAVGEARKLGYDAYFYHGPSASSVCIGAWPRRAVKEQEKDAASTYNPEQPILVSNGPLPERINWDSVYMKGRDGSRQRVKVMAPKVDVQDDSLRKALADPNLRRYAMNGAETDDPPFLSTIPHDEAATTARPGTGAADPIMSEPAWRTDRAPAGVGGLRGIGQ